MAGLSRLFTLFSKFEAPEVGAKSLRRSVTHSSAKIYVEWTKVALCIGSSATEHCDKHFFETRVLMIMKETNELFEDAQSVF